MILYAAIITIATTPQVGITLSTAKFVSLYVISAARETMPIVAIIFPVVSDKIHPAIPLKPSIKLLNMQIKIIAININQIIMYLPFRMQKC